MRTRFFPSRTRPGGPAAIPALLRRFVRFQQRLCFGFDRVFLPARFGVDGNRDFEAVFVPPYLRAGLTVYDIGGGKSPYVSPHVKEQLDLRVVGLDIDADELARAPGDAYDETIAADVCRFQGKGEADVAVCQAVLEHVPDAAAAVRTIASILRPGGVALVFVPSGNAAFARLNRLLPERVKRAILFSLFPDKREKQGFPAFYDRCTPPHFDRHAACAGLIVEARRVYFRSSYFSFFFPAYLLWRLWLLLFVAVRGDQAAETFAVALRKPVVPYAASGRGA